MRRFTDEEFAAMVTELTVSDPPSFHTLISIATKTLTPAIRKWCREDGRLSDRQYEDDILQETLIRLLKTCVTHFLYRTDELNNDPDGFRNWMYEVALNIKRDFANKVSSRDNCECSIDDVEEKSLSDRNDDGDAVTERLEKAFAVILDSDVKIYKILTWLAQCVCIVSYGITKKESNDTLIDAFAEKTLYNMRDDVYKFSENVPWMTFTDDHKRKIDAALSEEYAPGKTYGETKYKEFFMKKEGKATISDWVNRMNGIIRRNTEI